MSLLIRFNSSVSPFFSKMPEARRLGGPRGRVNNERGDNSYKTARLGRTAVFVMLMFKQPSKYGQWFVERKLVLIHALQPGNKINEKWRHNFLEMLRSMGKILDEPNVGIQTLRLMESIKHNKIWRWECILITSCLKELHSLIVKNVLIVMKCYSLFEVWQKIISVWVYCDLRKKRRRKKLIRTAVWK